MRSWRTLVVASSSLPSSSRERALREPHTDVGLGVRIKAAIEVTTEERPEEPGGDGVGDDTRGDRALADRQLEPAQSVSLNGQIEHEALCVGRCGHVPSSCSASSSRTACMRPTVRVPGPPARSSASRSSSRRVIPPAPPGSGALLERDQEPVDRLVEPGP